MVVQTSKPLRNNSDTIINSYNSHLFRVKFFNGKPSGVYADWTKGPNEETVTFSYDGNKLYAKQTTAFDELVDDMKSAVNLCGKPGRDGYHECLANIVFEKTSHASKQHKAVSKSLAEVSGRLRNYTCADDSMTTSESEKTEIIRVGKKEYTVETLLESSHANIWYIDNFITPEECGVFRKFGLPRLARATVAAEDGSSVVSEHRKAQQAGYNLHQINPKDPLA